MTENGRKFLEAVSDNEELCERVLSANTEQVIAIAKEYGFDVNEDDLAPGNADGSKLDMDELETVSGGKVCVCVAGGGGEATRKGQQVCACVAVGIGFTALGSRSHGYIRCYCAVGGGGNDLNDDEAWADVHS